jgi:hypothetical protein
VCGNDRSLGFDSAEIGNRAQLRASRRVADHAGSCIRLIQPTAIDQALRAQQVVIKQAGNGRNCVHVETSN